MYMVKENKFKKVVEWDLIDPVIRLPIYTVICISYGLYVLFKYGDCIFTLLISSTPFITEFCLSIKRKVYWVKE